MSNIAFGIGCSYFAYFEQTGVGAQWGNIAVSPLDGDSYSLLGCIGMLLADSLLYLILTWYIEAVFPGMLMQLVVFCLFPSNSVASLLFVTLQVNMVFQKDGISRCRSPIGARGLTDHK